MAMYKALDPNVEVMGAAIMSVVGGLGDTVVPVLEEHNLHPLKRENWYKQQDWLDAFEDLSGNGFMDLVSVGMAIPDNAVWPDHIDNIHDALASINVAYGMNHRGGEIGGYHYQKTDETSGIMVCDNPYPPDFDYGIIYRTAHKFRPSGKHLVVKYDSSKPSRKNGDKSCTYLIIW